MPRGTPPPFAPGEVARGLPLGNWYFNYAGVARTIAGGTYGPFDAAGVPLVDYDRLYAVHGVRRPGELFGTHYTPVTVAQ